MKLLYSLTSPYARKVRIVAAEKRISYGNFVVNKNTKKIFTITDQVASACAGMVADMQVLTRQVGALAKIRKLEKN
jgi:proteasome beta subunit